MARAYFGAKISPHMLKSPEGFLICYDVPIARTGKQKYLRKELGLTDNPDDVVNVYRIEEEVFNKKTIASFEGKVFTDEHPSDWVTPLNFGTYAKGAVTNVRRGTGQESDLLLADIIVYNQQQIEEIERKEKREVSCGYECEYEPYKDGFLQTNIIGNHVALVNAGRAGKRVAIKDNETNKNEEVKKVGYKIPRRSNVSDFLKAVGLKQVAMDSEPEDILDAMNELVQEKKEQEDAEAQQIESVKKSEEKVETPAEDEELSEVKETLANVQDALYSLMFKDAEPDYSEENEDADPEYGMESLDALETELEAEEVEDEDYEDYGEDADEVEEIRSIEKDPEEMNEEAEDEDCREMQSTADSAIELMRVLKPIIAAIPDSRQRKRVSDNLAKTLRKQVKDSKKKSVYSDFTRRTARDSAMNNPQDFGKMIAEKYNPHYKKEV